MQLHKCDSLQMITSKDNTDSCRQGPMETGTHADRSEDSTDSCREGSSPKDSLAESKRRRVTELAICIDKHSTLHDNY